MTTGEDLFWLALDECKPPSQHELVVRQILTMQHELATGMAQDAAELGDDHALLRELSTQYFVANEELLDQYEIERNL